MAEREWRPVLPLVLQLHPRIPAFIALRLPLLRAWLLRRLVGRPPGLPLVRETGLSVAVVDACLPVEVAAVAIEASTMGKGKARQQQRSG